MVDGGVLVIDPDDPDGRTLSLDPGASTWAFGPAPAGPETTADGEIAARTEVPLVSTGSSVLIWGGGVVVRAGEGSVSWCRPVGEGEALTPSAAWASAS